MWNILKYRLNYIIQIACYPLQSTSADCYKGSQLIPKLPEAKTIKVNSMRILRDIINFLWSKKRDIFPKYESKFLFKPAYYSLQFALANCSKNKLQLALASWQRAFVSSQQKPLAIDSFRLPHRTLIICLLLLTILTSCTPETVETEEELLTYVRDEDHGLYQKQERNGLEVSLMYRPTDLVINQELQSKKTITQPEIQKLKEQYGPYAYFVLSYSDRGKEALYTRSQGQGDFSEKLRRLSFRMGEYVHMTTSQKDTLYLKDSYYPRMHGMGTSSRVLLVFDRAKIEQSEWASLHVKDVGFGTGRMHFKINTKEIKDIPGLEFLKIAKP